jgi:transcriptional regulator with XRE-family HTH domain
MCCRTEGAQEQPSIRRLRTFTEQRINPHEWQVSIFANGYWAVLGLTFDRPEVSVASKVLDESNTLLRVGTRHGRANLRVGETRLLLDLYQQGQSTLEIQDRTGRHHGLVRNLVREAGIMRSASENNRLARRRGIHRARLADMDIRSWAQRWLAGAEVEELAAELDVEADLLWDRLAEALATMTAPHREDDRGRCAQCPFACEAFCAYQRIPITVSVRAPASPPNTVTSSVATTPARPVPAESDPIVATFRRTGSQYATTTGVWTADVVLRTGRPGHVTIPKPAVGPRRCRARSSTGTPGPAPVHLTGPAPQPPPDTGARPRAPVQRAAATAERGRTGARRTDPLLEPLVNAVADLPDRAERVADVQARITTARLTATHHVRAGRTDYPVVDLVRLRTDAEMEERRAHSGGTKAALDAILDVVGGLLRRAARENCVPCPECGHALEAHNTRGCQAQGTRCGCDQRPTTADVRVERRRHGLPELFDRWNYRPRPRQHRGRPGGSPTTETADDGWSATVAPSRRSRPREPKAHRPVQRDEDALGHNARFTQLLTTLGDQVRSRRVSNRLSQRDLADSTGIGWPALSGIERGKHNITLEVLWRLASALQVHWADLLERTTDPLPSQTGVKSFAQQLKTFGTRAYQARVVQRIVQQALADRTCIGRSAISEIEDGTHNITLNTLLVLATGLGVHCADLLDDRQSHPPLPTQT